jgi:hypothetical protein
MALKINTNRKKIEQHEFHGKPRELGTLGTSGQINVQKNTKTKKMNNTKNCWRTQANLRSASSFSCIL